jgi:hypothetical protein
MDSGSDPPDRVRGGLPHSDIRGSKLVRSSPRLFAAYHVLHRLRVPRHPPNALEALDRSHYPCPPRPGTRRSEKRTERPLKDPIVANDRARRRPERGRGLSRPAVESRRWVRKDQCHTRSARRRKGVRTHLLFTMSDIRRPEGRPQSGCRAHGAVSTRHAWGLPGASGPDGPEGAGRGSGGARRDRTDDLLLAQQALSQLSYGPWREPRHGWWAWDDSNVRPHPYQGCALTT